MAIIVKIVCHGNPLERLSFLFCLIYNKLQDLDFAIYNKSVNL